MNKKLLKKIQEEYFMIFLDFIFFVYLKNYML